MKTTEYFETSVRVRRPDIDMQWIESVLASPIRSMTQPNGRIRHWGFIKEMDKYLRVVTESDGETVHNAFFDRRFKD